MRGRIFTRRIGDQGFPHGPFAQRNRDNILHDAVLHFLCRLIRKGDG